MEWTCSWDQTRFTSAWASCREASGSPRRRSSIDNAVIGQQLLHYEILSRLGVGPAGEVYKARDTQGDRLVAIGALPPDLSNNPERRRRLEQAVAAASNVSHPN